MQITGDCHCGNIGFELDWPGTPGVIGARECGCSFCRKHGAIWTSSPEARLIVRIREPSRQSLYRFGTGTADFHVCRDCGGVPLASCLIDARRHAVVNVNCFHDIAPARIEVAAADFDAEDLDGRLRRRQRNWIGDVQLPEPM